MQRAVYPGTFDPFTHGHRHLIEQALAAGFEVVVAVGDNPAKKTLFTAAERVKLAQLALADVPRVQVMAFNGLLSQVLAKVGATVVLRGLRNGQDFTDNQRDDEFLLAHGGVAYTPFYIPPLAAYRNTSTSLLKAACAAGATMAPLACVPVRQALQWRMLGQRVVGVTGPSGAGKTYLCAALVKAGAAHNISVHHINADALVHRLYELEQGADAVALRNALEKAVGGGVLQASGVIDRAALSRKVEANPALLTVVEQHVFAPLTLLLQREILPLKGLILIDAPTLLEAGWLPLVHHHVVWVGAEDAVRLARLQARYGAQPVPWLARETPPDARLARLKIAMQPEPHHRLLETTSEAPPAPLLQDLMVTLGLIEA